MFGLTLVMGLFAVNMLNAQTGEWNPAGSGIFTTTGDDIHIIRSGGAAGAAAEFRFQRTNLPSAATVPIGFIRMQTAEAANQGYTLNYAFRERFGDMEVVQGVHVPGSGWRQYNAYNADTQQFTMANGVINALFQNTGKFVIEEASVGIGMTLGEAEAKLEGVKLGVNGKLLANEIEVKLFDTWPDFVFDNDYNLKSLSELENFINTNRHLPGVPTEAEVTENGVNLGQMTGVLLMKIEELTLHIIDLNKRIAELEK